jgi:hypothetical protein
MVFWKEGRYADLACWCLVATDGWIDSSKVAFAKIYDIIATASLSNVRCCFFIMKNAYD